MQYEGHNTPRGHQTDRGPYSVFLILVLHTAGSVTVCLNQIYQIIKSIIYVSLEIEAL